MSELAAVRVLIADDTADVRLLIGLLLGELPGITVVGEAVDGRDAVEAAARLQPDLVVLDQRMPVLDGLACVPELCAAAPAARILMMSAENPSMLPDPPPSSAVGYVAKVVAGLRDDLVGVAHVLDTAVGGLDGQHAPPARFPVEVVRRWDARAAAERTVHRLQELRRTGGLDGAARPAVGVRLDAGRLEVSVRGPRGAALTVLDEPLPLR